MRIRWTLQAAAIAALLVLGLPLASAQAPGTPALGGIREGSVYLFNPGAAPIQVYRGDGLTLPTHLKWTPDGQHLLFLAATPGAAGYSLMMSGAQGGTAAPVADNLMYMPVAFLPDGRVVYATPGEIGPAQDGSQLPHMTVSLYAQNLDAGAAPEKIAEVPFGTGCGGGSPFPMDAIYSMDAGFMGNELTLHMTNRGLLHSVSCAGVGLALLDLQTGQTTGVGEGLARATLAPDGTRLAAVRFQQFPVEAELVTVDLATLAVTPLATSETPDQVVWGADGAIYFSVRQPLEEPLPVAPEQMQMMIEAGRLGPDSQVPRYRVALYRLDPASGQETLLYETDAAWAIGRLFTWSDALYFSLIPGAQVWIDGLNANPVDMESRAGFLQEQSMVAPVLYRVPLAGGAPQPVLEDITAAVPRPAAS